MGLRNFRSLETCVTAKAHTLIKEQVVAPYVAPYVDTGALLPGASKVEALVPD